MPLEWLTLCRTGSGGCSDGVGECGNGCDGAAVEVEIVVVIVVIILILLCIESGSTHITHSRILHQNSLSHCKHSFCVFAYLSLSDTFAYSLDVQLV